MSLVTTQDEIVVDATSSRSRSCSSDSDSDSSFSDRDGGAAARFLPSGGRAAVASATGEQLVAVLEAGVRDYHRRRRRGRGRRSREASAAQPRKKEKPKAARCSSSERAALLSRLSAQHTAASRGKLRAEPPAAADAAGDGDSDGNDDGEIDEAEDEAQRELHRAATSSAGVEAGQRLFADAHRRRRLRQTEAEQAADRQSKSSEAKCTFRPALSEGTRNVILQQGDAYQPPSQRFDAQEQRAARERLLQRYAESAREQRECTFAPQVTPESTAMVQRAREGGGGGDGGGDGDVGGRLYDEGTARRARLQQREAQLREMEAADVVGCFRLSRREAGDVVARLHAWQRLRDGGISRLRHEHAAHSRGTSAPPGDVKALVERLCHPPPSAPPPQQQQQLQQQQMNVPRVNGRSSALAEEHRRLRYRALFARFATPGAPLTLLAVKRQVRTLFPKDVGIVAALARAAPPGAGDADSAEITRDAFADALTAFERRYGPQSWGRIETTGGGLQAAAVPPPAPLPPPPQRGDVPLHEALWQRQREQHARHEQRQREAASATAANCTFRPCINHISDALSRRAAERALAATGSGGSGGRATPQSSARRVPAAADSSDIVDHIARALRRPQTPPPPRAATPTSRAATPRPASATRSSPRRPASATRGTPQKRRGEFEALADGIMASVYGRVPNERAAASPPPPLPRHRSRGRVGAPKPKSKPFH